MALKNGRTSAALQTILVGSVIPPGVIQAFGGGTVPSGWLLCDGSTASRSTYSALFAAVGTVHGQGDGSLTFHLPDLRGRFVRGADNMGTGAAGRDANAATRTAANTGGATGATVGSVQADAMQPISGSIQSGAGNDPSYSLTWQSWSGAFTASYMSDRGITTGSQGFSSLPTILNIDSSQVTRTSSETRPQNANTSYIIKV